MCYISCEIIICNFLRFRFHCCQFPCWRQFPLYQLNYMESDHQNRSKRWHQRVQSHALDTTLTSHSKPINFNQSSRLIGTWKDFSVIIHAKLSPVDRLKMIPLHGIHPLFATANHTLNDVVFRQLIFDVIFPHILIGFWGFVLMAQRYDLSSIVFKVSLQFKISIILMKMNCLYVVY